MKKVVSVLCTVLIIIFAFSSCDLNNELDTAVESEIVQQFDLFFSMMGKTASEFLEEAEARGYEVTKSPQSNHYSLGVLSGCDFTRDSLYSANIYIKYFDTTINGGRQFLNIGDSIFSYGWDCWTARTPQPWEGDWTYTRIDNRSGYRDCMKSYFAELTDRQECSVTQLFQKPLGSKYIYVVFTYNFERADPLKEGEKVPKRELTVIVNISINNYSAAIFEDN